MKDRIAASVTLTVLVALATLGWSRDRAAVRPNAIGTPDQERVVLTPKPGPGPRINGAKVFGVRPGAPSRSSAATRWRSHRTWDGTAGTSGRTT